MLLCVIKIAGGRYMLIRYFCSFAILFFAFVHPTPLFSDPEPPTRDQEYQAEWVARFLENQHVSRLKVDDEISRRVFRVFLKTMDPKKLYLLKPDVERLRISHESAIDDELLAGKIHFPYEVYKIFLTRLKERALWVQQGIKLPKDFSMMESLPENPDDEDWASDAIEGNDRWRKQIKYEILRDRSSKKNPSPDDSENQIVRRLRHKLYITKEWTSGEFIESYLSTVASVFDPHSRFLSQKALEEFNEAMSLRLEGIGAMIRAQHETFLIERLIPGGPAAEDGRIEVGDSVSAVASDGRNFEDIELSSLPALIGKIRGKAGSKVGLRLINSKGETKEIFIIRAAVKMTDSLARSIIIDGGVKPNGMPFRIGVIVLPGFYSDFNDPEGKSCYSDVKRILEDFTSQSPVVDAVVMDLRDNGGGALRATIDMVGLFSGDRPVVQVGSSHTGEVLYPSDETTVVYPGPLAVIVNENSASASEIFAAAVQDLGRGLVVGSSITHGKGSVQSIQPYRPITPLIRDPNRKHLGGALKITSQQFFRINGDTTQLKGVTPDIILSTSDITPTRREGELPFALKETRVAKAPYETMGYTNATILAALLEKSQSRTQGRPEFGDNGVTERAGAKDLQGQRIPLDEEGYKNRFAMAPAKEQASRKPLATWDSPYEKEVLNILIDYNIELNNQPPMAGH